MIEQKHLDLLLELNADENTYIKQIGELIFSTDLLSTNLLDRLSAQQIIPVGFFMLELT